jgi:cell volume regulation protein A
MSPADLNLVLLVAAGVLLAGVAAVRVSTRAGLPSLLLYLGIGLLLGESGLGIVLEDANLVQVLGSVALAVILAEGGLTTRWEVIRPVLGLAGALATVGVAVSVTVTAGLAYLLLDVDGRTAVLLGAVVASTDAAAVFAVLRTMSVRRRTRAALEAESGFNDPPVIILVTVVASSAWDTSGPAATAGQMLQQLVVGLVAGLVVARAGQWVLARSALPSAGLYPLATLAIAMLAFAVGGVAGGSPFLAVYVAGLWLGNADLPHRSNTLGFAEGMAWLSQIGLFVMLGLLASPSRLPAALLPAIIVGSALLLVARPLSVLLVATPFRVPWREQAFMSWAGLRGAVPIVLATIPITAGLPAAERIFDVVFLLVVVFTLVQGPTLPSVARRLGVTEPEGTRDVVVESAPLDEIDASVISFTVPAGSRMAGVYVSELRLPVGSMVTLVVRDGETFVPEPATALRVGDHLLLVSTDTGRAATERRLRAVSRAGRLATWYGEQGEARPAVEAGPPATGSRLSTPTWPAVRPRAAGPVPDTGTVAGPDAGPDAGPVAGHGGRDRDPVSVTH